MKIVKYLVYNKTDGIMAWPEPFNSPEEAEKFMNSFRERFKFQGYYFTKRMERIDPKDVELEIEEILV